MRMKRSLIGGFCVALLAALSLVPVALHAAEAGARRQIPLREGWRFYFGEAPGAWQPAFDDHAWEAVSLPLRLADLKDRTSK